MRSRRAAAIASAITALWAAPAHAGCEQRADIRQRDPAASLAVGDSVMLAAAKQLAAYGFSVDAQACRRMDQGLSIMRDRELPSLVVVALGSNATVSAEQVQAALELVGPFGQLVFVLPRALGGGPDPDGRVMRAAERAYPDQVSILDWPGYSAGHDEWLASDGLHLTSAGANAFADFIAQSAEFQEPVDRIEPPPEPEPEKQRPPAPEPEVPGPLVAGMWSSVGHAFASFIGPGIRFLAQLVGDTKSAPQDL